jgi:hypothetical protein
MDELEQSSPLNPWETLNPPVKCGACGQSCPATGWTRGGKPICTACSIHGARHHNFDSRCPRCWVEREEARRDFVRILAYRQSKTKENSNESNH